MTSVMPAWKQALIEKKRKKEQEEKIKTQEENDRSASLPEWKKNLLARKKGLQGTDTHQGLDKQANVGNTSGHEKLGQKRSSFTTNSTDREQESNLGKKTPTVIIIPKENSRNGVQGGVRQHSFVASSTVPVSSQQKNNKQLDQKLSKNGHDISNNQGIVPEMDENNSKVSYEHIKTPSELRKLFGIVSRDSVSPSFAESNKIQNQQSQAHKDVSTKPNRNTSTRDYEESHKSTASTHQPTSSRESMSIKVKEVEVVKSHTPANNEEVKENNVITISNDNTGISAHSEDDDRCKIVKDDEIPADLHVDTIRTKFGPSGNFRLHKSSSSDNLLNSKHQPVSPRSRGKPPSPSKRWSTDVAAILSPPKSISDDEDTFDAGHGDTNMKRMRSISMGDVRISDHHFQDMEPIVNLKHRASVSSGIERRLQVLLHNLAVSDGKQDDYEEVDEDENMCLDQNVKNKFQDDHKNASTGSHGNQTDEDEPKIRKASWFNQEDDSKDTDLLHTYQDYDWNKKPAKKEEMKENKAKQVHIIEVSSSNQAATKPVPQESILMNGKISHEPEDAEEEKDEKPARGSVHKLSSLFGSSISKGSKKKKSKTDNNSDVTSKCSQEQHLNQENRPKSEKKDSQKSSSSRIFPWSKKVKKPEPVQDVKEGQSKPFGAPSLRPVQQGIVEQKITGNMTLVLNANAGSYGPKPKQKQPQLNSTNQAPGMGHHNGLPGQNVQENISSNKYKSKNKPNLVVRKPDDMMVTVIDVPDPGSSNDVEVSAIDVPESPSPTPVSVIDVPQSPDHDIKVSVIDMPDDEVDSDDSDSSGSCMSGSYDINPVVGSSVYTINETSQEEEEEEEDIDDVPVSYFGDSTYMKVPEVIFEKEVENVKSCLSSPLRSRKVSNIYTCH